MDGEVNHDEPGIEETAPLTTRMTTLLSLAHPYRKSHYANEMLPAKEAEILGEHNLLLSHCFLLASQSLCLSCANGQTSRCLEDRER